MMNLRHRLAKAIVCWLLKHSGLGAVMEADAADERAMVDGLRADLEAHSRVLRDLAWPLHAVPIPAPDPAIVDDAEQVA